MLAFCSDRSGCKYASHLSLSGLGWYADMSLTALVVSVLHYCNTL